MTAWPRMMTEERPRGEGRSRLNKLRKARVRRKRKRLALLAGVSVLVSFVILGYFLDIPFLNFVRALERRLWDRVGDEGPSASYEFLRYPRSGAPLEGDADALFALKNGEEVVALLLFTFNPSESKKELLLLPDGIHIYNAQGAEVSLRRVLSEAEGRDLLRAAAEGLSGAVVEYMVVYELKELVSLMDRISLPPVRPMGDVELVDLGGGRQWVSADQALRDSDRILSYLLAGDEQDALGGREARLRSYLNELLPHLEALDEATLEAAFAQHPPYLFQPDPAEALPVYLTSMVKAAADPGVGEMALRAIPRVEVLNGCGVPQLGARVAEALVSKGIRVSESTGNAKVVVDGVEYNDFTHEKSLIRYGREERRVSAYARYLGVLLSVTEVVFDPSVGEEVVLVAGRDAASGKFAR